MEKLWDVSVESGKGMQPGKANCAKKCFCSPRLEKQCISLSSPEGSTRKEPELEDYTEGSLLKYLNNLRNWISLKKCSDS